MQEQCEPKAELVHAASARLASKVPMPINVAGIDLNLLVALEALLLCRNVTHAAHRLGKTQPAISRALGRLRDVLGDDLLVRGSAGMRLTARGECLARTVPAAMAQVRELISSRRAEGCIRLSINSTLTPALLPFFLQSNPRGNEPLKLTTHKTPGEASAQLRAHMTDYILGSVEEGQEDMESEMVFSEDFVTLVAFERHSLGGIRPSEPNFLELRHVVLVENGREIFPQFSDTLLRQGLHRSNLTEVPDITSAALMVTESQLALTVPRSMAGWLTKMLRLSVLLPPVAIPRQEVFLGWLAGSYDGMRRRVIEDIAAGAGMAIDQERASVRVLRSLSGVG